MVVRLEVDPDQRDPDHGELRQPVRERGRLDQERGALDRVLQRQLQHRAEAALELDDPLAVRERRRDAAVVRETARQLVGDVEADPERELEPEVGPAAREAAGERGRVLGHREVAILPGVDGMPDALFLNQMHNLTSILSLLPAVASNAMVASRIDSVRICLRFSTPPVEQSEPLLRRLLLFCCADLGRGRKRRCAGVVSRSSSCPSSRSPPVVAATRRRPAAADRAASPAELGWVRDTRAGRSPSGTRSSAAIRARRSCASAAPGWTRSALLRPRGSSRRRRALSRSARCSGGRARSDARSTCRGRRRPRPSILPRCEGAPPPQRRHERQPRRRPSLGGGVGARRGGGRSEVLDSRGLAACRPRGQCLGRHRRRPRRALRLAGRRHVAHPHAARPVQRTGPAEG